MTVPRILVVYYSRSGNTRKVAKALSSALLCDIDEIVDSRRRAGPLGWARSLVEAVRRQPAEIRRPGKDPAAYDLVVLGSPVWAGSMSSPVRSYLIEQGGRLPALALFCTLGGRGARGAFADMERLACQTPRACLALTDRDVAGGAYAARVDEFAARLKSRKSAAQASPKALAA